MKPPEGASADPGGYAPPGGASAGAGFMQMGGPGTLIGAGENPPGQAPDCYGWTPSVKRFLHKFKGGKHCNDCGTTTVFLPVESDAWVCTACDAAVVCSPLLLAA